MLNLFRWRKPPNTVALNQPGLTFTPIDEEGLAIYGSWFSDDELRHRIEPPTRRWFDYVRHTPGCFAWLVHEEDIPVALVQLDTDSGGNGSVALVVRPDLRRRGYGTRVLRALLQRPEVLALGCVEAEVEVDNLAGIRCAEAAGFVRQGPEADGEGFWRLVGFPGGGHMRRLEE